jgi:hypothetical protein
VVAPSKALTELSKEYAFLCSRGCLQIEDFLVGCLDPKAVLHPTFSPDVTCDSVNQNIAPHLLWITKMLFALVILQPERVDIQKYNVAPPPHTGVARLFHQITLVQSWWS